MPTTVVFKTVGQINIPVGTQQSLTTVDVSPFAQIRIVVGESAGSPSDVRILPIFTMGPGAALIGQLDTILLTPGTVQTKVYDVPGIFLNIMAQALPGPAGNDAVELFIFGNPY